MEKILNEKGLTGVVVGGSVSAGTIGVPTDAKLYGVIWNDTELPFTP